MVQGLRAAGCPRGDFSPVSEVAGHRGKISPWRAAAAQTLRKGRAAPAARGPRPAGLRPLLYDNECLWAAGRTDPRQGAPALTRYMQNPKNARAPKSGPLMAIMALLLPGASAQGLGGGFR